MFKFLKHLFLPHEKNNHRAKIIHNSSLATIFSIFLILNFVWVFLSAVRPDILGLSYSISEQELLVLVNREREKIGLAPLTLDPQLSDAARRKAADMLEKNYWAHFAPDGSTSPWGFIRAAGYNYIHAGENLARGFTDSDSAVRAWMNSQTHRDNILAEKYQDVGFAIVPGTLTGEETVLIVKMFGARTPRAIAAVQQSENMQGSSIQGSSEAKPAPPVSDSARNKSEPVQAYASKNRESSPAAQVVPKVDSRISSRAVSTVGLTFLAFAFIMDLVIAERRKIPRVVGHNLDHIMLILAFLLFVFLQRGGHIL
jgi:hypothetical protein